MVVGFTLIFEGETTVWNVVQVLQPFEEWYGDTTSIDVQIWDDQDVAFDEDLVGSWGGRTVGSFSNNLESWIYGFKDF